MAPFQPLRAVAYGALPCAVPASAAEAPQMASCMTGLPSEDMVQAGYQAQWGADGRNDLGKMKALGANAVRLYHSMGLGAGNDHSKFLDYAESLKLNVIPGVHSTDVEDCPAFDCFTTWKSALADGFKQGYQVGDGWHPAVAAVVLMNEPDFYENSAMCHDMGAWCRVKAVISALDGLLAAEQEAGMEPGRVKLTVTWSFAMRTSIDGLVEGPGTFGFQDMVAAVANPSIANYTPRMNLTLIQESFQKRWIHGLNTQAPWTFVHEFVSQHYKQFEPIPWFIGEYGANGQSDDIIKSDLSSMDQSAREGGSFLGATVFQFQTAYSKGGSELNFGLFSLGSKQIGETGDVCDRKAPCKKWPVFCLQSKLPWLPEKLGLRAEAVAAAWDGELGSFEC